MNLIEIKILFNADYQGDDVLPARQYVEEILWYIQERPDVISFSKTNIPEGGGDEGEE